MFWFLVRVGSWQLERFELIELKQHTNNLNKTMVERDRQIADQNQVVAEREEQIANLNQLVA